MKRSGIILLFILLPRFLSLEAQEQKGDEARILFRGVVLSASERAQLQDVQIMINGRLFSRSRSDGTFSFYARPRDTVVFASMGFKPQYLYVADTLRADEFLTGVYMQSDTLAIGEVVVMPRMRNLKAEMTNPRQPANTQMDNARSNLSIASYQGRTGQGKLGDPSINYQVIRQKLKTDAYEKGGIPSDKIAGISPLLIVPAAYLLLHSPPEQKNNPPEVTLSNREIEDLNKLYNDIQKRKQAAK
ncbi:MAG: hypothetical protein U0X39_03980 [Bacteroidales bacterium]